MIDHAVNLVARRLNQHLVSRYTKTDDKITPEDIVLVSGLVDEDGKQPEKSLNRLLIFVTNIAQDSMRRGFVQKSAANADGQVVQPEPVHLNITLMLASSFYGGKYLHGLQVLSHAIEYFQSRPVFDARNEPDLDPSLQQLSLEISNLETDNLSHLWGTMGGSYLPSILYLMRTVTIDADAVTRKDPVVDEPVLQGKTRAG